MVGFLPMANYSAHGSPASQKKEPGDVLDMAETTLLYILDGFKVEGIFSDEPDRKVGGGDVVVSTAIDHRSHVASAPIECPLVFGISELHTLHRWISSDPDDLMGDAVDLIGDGSEQICCAGPTVKWLMVRPIKKLPGRYFTAAVGSFKFFEMHYRQWHYLYPEKGLYRREFTAYSQRAKTWCKVMGPREGAGQECHDYRISRRALAWFCSLEEDANLFWRIKLTEDASCYLSADGAAVIDLFKHRHAPLTPSGRRKAIMHWVRNYTRRAVATNREVKEHLRGVHSFNFGTTLVEIFAPPFEAARETTRVAKMLQKSGELELHNSRAEF